LTAGDFWAQPNTGNAATRNKEKKGKNMKNLFIKVLGTSLLYAATTFAQSANEIAKKVHDLPSGKTSSATISVTLIDKNGKTRNREIASYTMKDGTTDKTVLVFKTPRDVAGISYLTYDYPDKADGTTVDSDSWIYLPAMKKVRRVSGSSKDDDFQGTDFTYDDLGTRSLSKDNFALLGEEKVNGVDCWILEAKAKDAKAKVSRRITWVDKKTYVVRKGEYYDKQNRLQKTLSCENIQQVKGYWTTLKMTMTNVQTNHKTVYEINNLKYDEKVNESYFTVSALERELVK
jgi:outer membrane lipoprotein-sorting protein